MAARAVEFRVQSLFEQEARAVESTRTRCNRAASAACASAPQPRSPKRAPPPNTYRTHVPLTAASHIICSRCLVVSVVFRLNERPINATSINLRDKRAEL